MILDGTNFLLLLRILGIGMEQLRQPGVRAMNERWRCDLGMQFHISGKVYDVFSMPVSGQQGARQEP